MQVKQDNEVLQRKLKAAERSKDTVSGDFAAERQQLLVRLLFNRLANHLHRSNRGNTLCIAG